MDGAVRAGMTAGVAPLIGLFTRGGLDGRAAALPCPTTPTLAWLVPERGIGHALAAATGGDAACAALAAFVSGYLRRSRRTGILAASGAPS